MIIKEEQGENGALSHKAGAFKEILEELKHPIRSLQFGGEFRVLIPCRVFQQQWLYQ